MFQNRLAQLLDWLPFAAGLLAGVALAFLIYAGLQPRLQTAVRMQQEQKEKAARRDSAAAASAQPAAPARPPVGPARPATAAPSPAAAATATATAPAAPASTAPAARPVRLTSLAPSGPAAAAPGRRPWLAVGLVLAVAVVAGAAAWQQFRQPPQPPGAITSPVLEALFMLPTHREMLQKTLGLSPRQIKRFSSKARVQHSQLRAQAHPGPGRPGIPFPLNYQIKAFQLLLLLEENRQLPQRFPQRDAAGFMGQVQAAYLGHAALTTARIEAEAHPVILAARAKESTATCMADPDAEEHFLRQLYEMNAGLLA